jgi:hypothetical protein
VSERPKPALLYVLAALLFLETAAVVVGTVYLGIEIFAAKSASIPSAIALTVTCAVAAVGLAIVAISTLRARPWIRGAAVCWQIIQILVAYSILQAQSPAVAWALIVPAIVIIALLFSRPVLAATARPKAES